MKIFHNSRCSKSRKTLEIILKENKKIKIINYQQNSPTHNELRLIIKKLKIQPIELVRKNEKIWKENYKDKQLNDDKIIDILIKNPKLIERPIVFNESNAIICRPPENVYKILN